MTAHKWTAKEIETLRQLRQQGMRYKHIASHLGLELHQVENKAFWCGIMIPRSPIWTTADRDELWRMHTSGYSRAQISRKLKRTLNAVSVKLCHERKRRPPTCIRRMK